MILVVGGIKGGSGKTTIATNLTVMRAATGKKVLLVDADEQKSAFDWSIQRQNNLSDSESRNYNSDVKIFVTVCMAGKSIYSNLKMMRHDYDDIIIDTGGRDTTSQRSALCIADSFLMPFKPSSVDIWTIGAVKRILSEVPNSDLRSYAFISQADCKGKDNDETMKVLQENDEFSYLDCRIANRKAFRNAASEGLSVEELEHQDLKACKEMRDLYERLY